MELMDTKDEEVF